MSTCSAGKSRSLPVTCSAHQRATSGASITGSARRNTRASSPWSAARSDTRLRGGAHSRRLAADGPGLVGLFEQAREARDVVVPLDQGRDLADALAGVAVEGPH